MRSAFLFVAGFLSLATAHDAAAQLKGHYIPGFTGLMDGTQPPPGISIALPVYFYTTNDIRNDAGDKLGVSPRINVTFLAPVVAWVTNVEVLGANLGGSIVPVAFIKSRIEGNSLDVPGSFAFTDIEVQPLQLGWETKDANFVASWGVFLPTGKWEQGGRDNAGLGMWSNLFQAGTTLHLDTKQLWNFSTLGSYEIHTHKRGSDIRVGDILTLEGWAEPDFRPALDQGGNASPVAHHERRCRLLFRLQGDERPGGRGHAAGGEPQGSRVRRGRRRQLHLPEERMDRRPARRARVRRSQPYPGLDLHADDGLPAEVPAEAVQETGRNPRITQLVRAVENGPGTQLRPEAVSHSLTFQPTNSPFHLPPSQRGSS